MTEAQTAVQKILDFETSGQTLAGKAALVADNPDLAGEFEANQDEIATLLPSRTVEKLYLTQLGTTATKAAVRSAFDSGLSLMSYVGHGSSGLWASEGILRSPDVASFAPQPAQPLVLAMTCSNGYFLSPFNNSLAERLVLAESKGAIAAFAPSGLSLNDAAHVYHRAVVAELESGAHTAPRRPPPRRPGLLRRLRRLPRAPRLLQPPRRPGNQDPITMAAGDLCPREPRAARAAQASRRALVTTLVLCLAFVAAAREATAAQLKSVRSGTATVVASVSSSTVLLAPAVDPTKAFLVFGVSENTTSAADGQVSGQITAGGSAVTFYHNGITDSATIWYYIAEFSSGVSVQRGRADLTAGSTVNVTLSPAVNAAKSFPLISHQITDANFDDNDFVRAKITSGTNLQLSYTGATAPIQHLEWQVVEYQDAKVQTGDSTFSSGNGSVAAPLTAVNVAKSWLIFSYQCDASGCPGPDPNIGNKMVRGVISSSTTLNFDRNNIGKGLILTWYLVEFTDDTIVQSGSQNFAATEVQKDITITAAPLGRSLAAAGGYTRGGRTPLSTSANPGVAWFTLNLTTSTNLRITRGASSDAADVGWFVVTFGATGLYRSVGTATTDLNTSLRTVTISGNTATFSGPMPDKVGVGDVLQYQVAATYYVAFIHARTSSTVYTVASATAGTPQAAVAGTAVSVYRAYTSLFNWEARSENTSDQRRGSEFRQRRHRGPRHRRQVVMNAACYGDGADDTTQTTINGWTTDPTHYIRIYTPYLPSEVGVSQRHKGVWDATKYVIRSTYAPIDIGDGGAGTNSVWIDGLQIWLNSVTGGGNSGIITNQTGVANHRFSNNIVRGDLGSRRLRQLRHPVLQRRRRQRGPHLEQRRLRLHSERARIRHRRGWRQQRGHGLRLQQHRLQQLQGFLPAEQRDHRREEQRLPERRPRGSLTATAARSRPARTTTARTSPEMRPSSGRG